MANDVSYFKVAGDNTTYSFNDADLETAVSTLQNTVSGHTTTINSHTTSIGNNTTNIATNKSAIGTLSNLTTSAKGNLVAAINEVSGAALQQKGTLQSTNIAAFVTQGVYFLSGDNTYTNLPSGVTWGTLIVFRPIASNAYYTVHLLITAGSAAYTQIYTPSGWTTWKSLGS